MLNRTAQAEQQAAWKVPVTSVTLSLCPLFEGLCIFLLFNDRLKMGPSGLSDIGKKKEINVYFDFG